MADAVLWSVLGEKPRHAQRLPRTARTLALDFSTDDLDISAKPFAPAFVAKIVARVRAIVRAAVDAAVHLIGDGEFLLLRDALQPFQFIGDLAAAKERLEDDGIALGHN